AGLESSKPIVIGDDVWIGGDVTILPGVKIGSGCVIGAKSLVTKDIPDNVLALGNPAQVVKRIGTETLLV
ncbi:MAG: sugar O-acetyltransferase, partial [Quinella sp. 2Q5]|nr:sugar O-acetyltransferase [Quinella sp. 2Q5]